MNTATVSRIVSTTIATPHFLDGLAQCAVTVRLADLAHGR